uniref:Uncharacterized protein n=1 Tax=Romanomermis culicivorax TaxID=13658 RepID=A0A915HG30_ROMCU
MPRNYKRKRPDRSTLHDKYKSNHSNKVERPTVFTQEEELAFVDVVIKVAEWGFPLSILDLKHIIKGYLDRAGRKVENFVENKPGKELCLSFLKHHENALSQRFASNIKRSRALVSVEEMEKYFGHLKTSLEGASPENIFN